MGSLIIFSKDAAVKAGLVVTETDTAVTFVLPKTIFAEEATLNEQGYLTYDSHRSSKARAVLIDWLESNHIEYEEI